MNIDPLTTLEFDVYMDSLKATILTEYQQVLANPAMPKDLRQPGDASMLKIATRKVARSIWLPPNARQPEKDYGKR